MIAVLCGMLASCDATIHFYPEPEPEPEPEPVAAPVRIHVDWSGYGKNVPMGMTVMCQHVDSGRLSKSIDNNIDYVTPYLLPGRYWAAVFNLTEGEFQNIGFRGLDALETAEAYPRRQSCPAWYADSAGDSTYIACEPDWLAVDTIMTDPVNPFDQPETGVKVIGTLHPKNIIYTLHVTIHSDSITNLRSARSVISGFASGRRLASDRPNDNAETVTLLMGADVWTREKLSTNSSAGCVKANVRCFGLPGNHQGKAEENILEFQAMLTDGKSILKFVVPVGDVIEERNSPADKRGDNLDLYINVWLDFSLPTEENPGGDDDKPGGDSGDNPDGKPGEKPEDPDEDPDRDFNVWVDDWDQQEDIIISIGSNKRFKFDYKH